MPHPSEHHEERRRRLIRIARNLFNRRGFDAVSIDDIMAGAGLTRGGFYSYFSSKSALYAVAIEEALLRLPAARCEAAASPADFAQRVICTYLTPAQLNESDDCCPMMSLPGDVSRSDRTVSRAFESGFRDLVSTFESSLQRERGSNRDRALVMAALCVGAMGVARAITDLQLAIELRDAALRVAFELAGWSNAENVAMREAPRVLAEQAMRAQ
jgi:TetR/AcrR family transcriptional repressor of nem operon